MTSQEQERDPADKEEKTAHENDPGLTDDEKASMDKLRESLENQDAKITAAMTADEAELDKAVNEDEVGPVADVRDYKEAIENDKGAPYVKAPTSFTFACPKCANKITVEAKTWVGATKCYRCGHVIDEATLQRLIEG